MTKHKSLLIVTSSFHFIALYYALYDTMFACVMFFSIVFSILWHLLDEPMNIIFYLDYLFALIETFCEIYLTADNNYHYTKRIIYLNLIILVLNKIIDRCADYAFNHSMWHIISALKYYYVARLLYLNKKY